MRTFDANHGCRVHEDRADPECFGCLIGAVMDEKWLETMDRLVAERFPEKALHHSH